MRRLSGIRQRIRRSSETVVKTWASSSKLADKIGLRGALLDGTIPADAIIDEPINEPLRAVACTECGESAFIDHDGISQHGEVGEIDYDADADHVALVEAPDDTPANASDGEQTMADRFPPGTRVIVQVDKRKREVGSVDYRVDATSCRVKIDGPYPSVLYRYNQLSLDDGSEPMPAPAKTERKARAAPLGDRQPSRRVELDMLAATGVMPTKPIMTSPANKEQYQKRFDLLEKAALAGDWDAVRAYEVKGINSYAKMVKQYQDRLLAAHAAQQQASKTEAA